MGLWEFLRQWQRSRLVAGIVTSSLVHALLVVVALWGLVPGMAPPKPKKGDTLIVELPRPEEPASPASAAPPNTPPAPPAPKASAPVAAKPSPPARREPTPAPPREERRIASAPTAPEPAPRAPEPAPKAPEPALRQPEPPPSTPAQSAPEPVPRAEEPAPRVAEPAPPRLASPAPAAERREGGDRQVASLPPAEARPSVGDVRAALARGTGGRGQGRGGIEGEPVPLDTPNTDYSDYLEQVGRKIKAHWGFPCVKNPDTRGCDHHSTSLDIQFGILKDGRVEFVDVVRHANYDIYDEYAINAIKLASPFPPVPPALMRRMKAGSTGAALSVRFVYVVESSLTNLLR
jgi:outer membrane biosynthesis protein TonB